MFLPTTRRARQDSAFAVLAGGLAALSLLLLGLVVFYVARESAPLLRSVPLADFLFGQRWMPVDYGTGESFGIFNFICGTLFVSVLALFFSCVVSVGTALFLSCSAGRKTRAVVLPCIDLLAGIPSVVYGFIGLVVVVRLFLQAGSSTGTCVLAAALVLAVMITPFLVSSVTESMLEIRRTHLTASNALGVEHWHGVAHIVLPLTLPSLFPSLMLAFGRAMGETIAVMMVMGNANLFPTLLGKGETLASLIALETGTAAVNSLHYHALFAAALVLMVLLLAIDVLAAILRRRALGR